MKTITISIASILDIHARLNVNNDCYSRIRLKSGKYYDAYGVIKFDELGNIEIKIKKEKNLLVNLR